MFMGFFEPHVVDCRYSYGEEYKSHYIEVQ